MPPRCAPYDVILDADSRCCVVLEARRDGTLAYCPALDQRVLLEPPLEVLPDPSPFLRLQPTSRLVVALIAWHARASGDGTARVAAELRAILAAPGQPSG